MNKVWCILRGCIYEYLHTMSYKEQPVKGLLFLSKGDAV
jgi:hypothetical protein